MRKLYLHGGKAYLIIRRASIGLFENKKKELNMENIGLFRDWVGADHVLRDQTHFMFCETIEDVEWEEIGVKKKTIEIEGNEEKENTTTNNEV